MGLKIIKKGNKNFTHIDPDFQNQYGANDITIIFDGNTVKLRSFNGRVIFRRDGYDLSEVIVMDESASSVEEPFTDVNLLKQRLISLGYPFACNGGGGDGPSSGIQDIFAGDNISINKDDPNNPVISANVDNPGVESVTGDGVDNTNPASPTISFPSQSDLEIIRPLKTVGGQSLEGTGDIPISSGGIPEAPNDGQQYARQDEGWSIVSLPSGDDILSIASTITTSTDAIPSHADGMNEVNSPTDVTITIQDNSTENIPVGTVLTYRRVGEGNVIVAYNGSASGDEKQTYKYADVLTLWHKSLNQWVVINTPHALDSTLENEPTGSGQILNTVSLTQAEYDAAETAGTLIPTTKYIITDASGGGGGSSQWDDVTGGINYAGGNVGIGKLTPDEKLDVNGNIKALNGIIQNNLKTKQISITGNDGANSAIFFLDSSDVLPKTVLASEENNTSGFAIYLLPKKMGVFVSTKLEVLLAGRTSEFTAEGDQRPDNLNSDTDRGIRYYDVDLKGNYYWDGIEWLTPPSITTVGTTAERPSGLNLKNGFQYFDTTLGKPIWYLSALGWVDSTGTAV